MNSTVYYLMAVTWSIHAYSNIFFLLAPYLELKGFASEHTGILVGAFYAATTLIRPAGSWITERAGIRRTLTASSLLCLLAALCMFAAVSFVPLLIIRLAMGCFWGVFVVALTTYQSLVIPDSIRGKAFLLITIGSLSCFFTVVPLSEWFIKHGMVMSFLAAPACMAVLCAALSFRLPPLASGSAPESGGARWGTWGEFYRDAPFWRMAASCSLFGLCDASIAYMPAVVLSMGLVPSSFVVAHGVGALAARFLGRELFNRYPRYVFAGPSLLLMGVFLYLAAMARTNVQLVMCGLFYGVGVGYGYPAHQTLTGDLVPVPLRAKASSFFYFCNDASWFVLPVYVGFAAPYTGAAGAFKFLAVLSAAAGVGVILMWRRYGQAGKRSIT